MVKSQGSDIVQRGRYYLNAFPFTSYYSYMEGLSIAAFKEVHQFYVKVANSITTFIRSPEYIVFQDTSLKMMIAFYKSTKAFLISAFYFLKECYWDHSYYSRKDKIKRD